MHRTESSTSPEDIEKAARNMDFMTATRLRDEMFKMQKELEEIKG